MQRLVSRPRPSPLLVHVSHHKQSKSFPSGHVTSSLTFWGWLLAVGLFRLKGSQTRQKALLSIPALLVAFAGPSRVYLGEHWATDVLGGYLLGGGWVSLCLQVYLQLRKRGVLMTQQRQRWTTPSLPSEVEVLEDEAR
jgi:membrane-associated phospholipid phosphatase